MLNTIQEAIDDIKLGKLIIVVDDEDRENEGDFICAAEKITPEMVNFMATHGRGLICTPIKAKRAEELNLDRMVSENTALHETAFTISIDLVGKGCSTGISAYDRATGIKAMVEADTEATDFARPGHIFPLIAKEGGVLRRTGHTEAAVDLAELAGFYPAGVLVEILNEDGTMARMPQLVKIAEKFDLKIISIEDLIEYRMKNERIVIQKYSNKMDTKYGQFNVFAYEQITSGDIHLAFVMGEIDTDASSLVRVHSTTETGGPLAFLFENYLEKLDKAFRMVAEEKRGVILFMQHGEKGASFINKLRELDINKSNDPTVSDQRRDYGVGAQILRDLGVQKMRLLRGSSSKKHVALLGYGLEIESQIDL